MFSHVDWLSAEWTNLLLGDPVFEAVEVELVVFAALEHHDLFIRCVLEVAQAN